MCGINLDIIVSSEKLPNAAINILG